MPQAATKKRPRKAKKKPAKKARPLTAKQSAFVTHYVETGNATEAVQRAGYASKHPNKMAAQLRGNDAVNAAIEKLQKAAASAARVTPKLIMDGLLSIASNPKAEHRDQIAAWRALQNMTPGALVPKQVELAGTGGGPVVHAHVGLSPEADDHIRRRILGLGTTVERPDGEPVH